MYAVTKVENALSEIIDNRQKTTFELELQKRELVVEINKALEAEVETRVLARLEEYKRQQDYARAHVYASTQAPQQQGAYYYEKIEREGGYNSPRSESGFRFFARDFKTTFLAYAVLLLASYGFLHLFFPRIF